MYEFDRANFNGRLQDLKKEEERLEKYLTDNSNSIADYELKRVKNTLTGIRVEEQEITQIMSGGFY